MALADIFFQIVLPVAQFSIMVGLGMTLSPNSFAGVVRAPRAALVGLFAQLVLLPTVALALLLMLKPGFAIGMGLAIVAACPGGTASNIFSFLARADVPLSITLTAINSCIVVFTMPVILLIANSLFYSGGPDAIGVPAGLIAIQLVVMTIVPISVGMLVRHYFTRFAAICAWHMRPAAAVFMGCAVVFLLYADYDLFVSNLGRAGSYSIGFMAINMLVALGLSRMWHLSRARAATVVIEVGIQNGVLAIYVAGTIMGSEELAILPTVYGILAIMVMGLGLSLAKLRNQVFVP